MPISRRGITAISTLILFIALIIVTAIAANVLMQSTNILQTQVSKTGKETQGEIATKLNIVSVAGETNDANTAINYLRMTIKMTKSADPILIENMYVSVQTDENYITGITYNKSASDSESDLRTAVADQDYYSVRYLGNVANNRDYIEPNELTEIWYNLNGLLEKNEELTVVLGPDRGYQTKITLITPNVFNKDVMDLY